MDVYEHDVQRKLERELSGKHESCPAGVPDLVTSTELIEIKVWKNWKNAMGQLIAYHEYFPDKNMRAHFFGPFPSMEKRICIITHLVKNNIRVSWEEENVKLCENSSCGNIVPGWKNRCTKCFPPPDNGLKEFIVENIQKVNDPKCFIELTVMYQRYRDWFQEYFALRCMDRQLFVPELSKIFKYEHRKFYGVKLTEPYIIE